MDKPFNCSILIVDDEAMLLNSLASGFKLRGFDVHTASSGNEAVEIVKTKKIDFILSDVRMPNGDGVSLIKQVKDFSPNLPIVVFMTGFSDLTVDEVYDLGAEAIFSKPFDKKALIQFIKDKVQNRDNPWATPIESGSVQTKIERTYDSQTSAKTSQDFKIGRGGFFLKAEDRIANPSELLHFEVKFEKDKINKISGSGIVRWVRDKAGDLVRGLGIEFIYLEPGCKDAVKEQIDKEKLKAYIPKG